MSMTDDELYELKRAEAAFFDQLAITRTVNGQIPFEADIRRATRFIPTRPDQLLMDPQMIAILDGDSRIRFIDWVAHMPRGRVLDICCGPGWLALELGRRGQTVDAYDISPGAIALAKRMLAENPYRDGFGQVNYHLQDVTQIDLGRETYDAVSGWSAFHHITNLSEFMDRVWQALKPGGIVATMDDMPRGWLETWLGRFFRLLLPSYNRTYVQKFAVLLKWLMGITKAPPEVFSPMEATKHTSVYEIESIWREKFELVENIQFNAFASEPVMTLSGSDRFRYPVARALVGLDRLLCRTRVCKGFFRIIIARKK
jgi:2-polyprenyl-3-methyl-5-hydroxy-6-metoxy-1,4-benzoquinol methylase